MRKEGKSNATASEFRAASHVAVIDRAMAGLLKLEIRTRMPADVPHQYVGTIVDNTIVLLASCGNALDGGTRRVSCSEAPNWVSAMQAVHRSFFSSIQMAAELGLRHVCKERGTGVHSAFRGKVEKQLAIIEEGLTEAKGRRALVKLRKQLTRSKPEFADYLNAGLEAAAIPSAERKTWRKFFGALGIVRNKASHSDSSLSETEREGLRGGGFGGLVSSSGSLVMNPSRYVEVSSHVLDFLDLIAKKPAEAG